MEQNKDLIALQNQNDSLRFQLSELKAHSKISELKSQNAISDLKDTILQMKKTEEEIYLN